MREGGGVLPVLVHDVDLPAHVGVGEAVVVDYVGPGGVGGDLQDGRLPGFAAELQGAVVFLEGGVVVVQATVAAFGVF